MKALIVYDSFFGNTEKVARSMGDALASGGNVEVVRAEDVKIEHLKGLDLLIVGSPTRAFRPSPATGGFLGKIPEGALKGVKTGAFDTRIDEGDVSLPLRVLMRIFGYAAGRISADLRKRGGRVGTAPEGFIVGGKEGPLKEGELERAADWARGLAETG